MDALLSLDDGRVLVLPQLSAYFFDSSWESLPFLWSECGVGLREAGGESEERREERTVIGI